MSTPLHPDLFAVLAVSLEDMTTGTVISLHVTHAEAWRARQGYRRANPLPQADLYVVWPVSDTAMPGMTMALAAGKHTPPPGHAEEGNA
jgi:hypothetical protein